MATYTQDNLSLSVSTPLGPDVLILKRVHGEEAISRLFQFTLTMVSEEPSLDFSKIVGKTATVTVELVDRSNRYINGTVVRFIQGDTQLGFTTYYAEMSPWLSQLTMASDCRIFQNQTVPEIVTTIFTDLQFADYRDALSANYSPREYCVQYQESTFDFVSRLMEDEGIFYFFEHEDGKHTLVFSDDAGVHQTHPGLDTTRFQHSATSLLHDDVITQCTLEQQVSTGTYQMGDFSFETPETPLFVTADDKTPTSTMTMYEYPGGFSNTGDGEAKANHRIEAHEVPSTLLRGTSFCRAFTSGYNFTMTEHDRQDMNQTYLLRGIFHTITPESYLNTFEAVPSDIPFRPPRVTPKPTISGTQTAIVVGKSGEEIWTDKYGRVIVQFHWDRNGKNDENSSCWIRVAQMWAGKTWGSFFIPRMDQEVVVSFLDGDPDQPLITGVVYNATQTVPYTLPTDMTKSTIKSNSSKGGAGFNEIRFEDKKDSEELYLHAQKDMALEVKNDYKLEVGNDHTIDVKKGNETHNVKGTRDLTVTGEETHVNEADHTHNVSGDCTLKVDGNLTIEAGGNVTIKGTMIKLN